MRTHSKLILAALAATILLALGVSTATAGRLSVNEQNFEVIWNRALFAKRNLEFSAASSIVKCPVTLLGSLVERTVKKEGTIRMAKINHATVAGTSCEGGSAIIRSETLPWESRYRSFGFLLPQIKDIRVGLIRATFRITETNGLECEAATEPSHPGVGVVGESGEAPESGLEFHGEPENFTAERANGIPLGGSFLCAFGGEGHFSGVGLILNLPRTAKLRITLI